MASSTTIPRAKMNENITSMFMVNPIHGKTMYAIAIDKGTEKPTKIALTRPMKNIRTIVTRTNPIIIVLLRSLTVFLVKRDWSPVI
jgi:hypothetical protein